jgi:hypothetical protein
LERRARKQEVVDEVGRAKDPLFSRSQTLSPRFR